MEKIGTVTPGYVPALPVYQSQGRSPEQFRAEVSWWQVSKLRSAKQHLEADALLEKYSLMGWI